jgi:hypothetical protein
LEIFLAPSKTAWRKIGYSQPIRFRLSALFRGL